MKFFILALLVVAAFAQNTNGDCTSTANHYQVKIDGSNKCIQKVAFTNLPGLKTALEGISTVSAEEDKAVKTSFTLTQSTTCGTSNDQTCLDDTVYSISLKNKSGQDAAEASGTLLANNVIIDNTKALDTSNWCEDAAANGEQICKITVELYLKDIDVLLFSKEVSIKVTRVQERIVDGQIDDVTGVSKDLTATAVESKNILFKPSATIKRSVDGTHAADATGDVTMGDQVFLRMKVTETSEEAFVLTPGKYTVFLVDEADNKINITEQCDTPTNTVDNTDNYFDIVCSIDYVGTYSIEVNGERVPPARRRRFL